MSPVVADEGHPGAVLVAALAAGGGVGEEDQAADGQGGFNLTARYAQHDFVVSNEAELNAAIAEQVALVNDRSFRGQAISRRQLFDEVSR